MIDVTQMIPGTRVIDQLDRTGTVIGQYTSRNVGEIIVVAMDSDILFDGETIQDFREELQRFGSVELQRTCQTHNDKFGDFMEHCCPYVVDPDFGEELRVRTDEPSASEVYFKQSSGRVAYYIKWHEPYEELELRQMGEHWTLFRKTSPTGKFKSVQPTFTKPSVFRNWLEQVYKPQRVGDLVLAEAANWPDEHDREPHVLHPDAHKYRKAQAVNAQLVSYAHVRNPDGIEHRVQLYRTATNTYELRNDPWQDVLLNLSIPFDQQAIARSKAVLENRGFTINWWQNTNLGQADYFKQADSELVEKLGDIFWREVNGRHFIQGHPINYYAKLEPEELDSADAIYDIINETWIKQEAVPDITSVKEQFPVAYDTAESVAKELDSLLGQLRRYVRDRLSEQAFTEAEQLFQASDKLFQAAAELDSLVKQLADIYQTLHTARHNAFECETDRWSKNWTDENIVWKLLEHWGYIDKLKVVADMFWDGQAELDVLAKVALDVSRHFKLSTT
jgi:hypothetical protein